jgi:hypothetical protein
MNSMKSTIFIPLVLALVGSTETVTIGVAHAQQVLWSETHVIVGGKELNFKSNSIRIPMLTMAMSI